MGLINKVDMVCLSPVGYDVQQTFRALALRRSRQTFSRSYQNGNRSTVVAHFSENRYTFL